MIQLEGSYLTDEGKRMVAQTGSNSIVFTRAVTGDGEYTEGESVGPLTELKNQVQEFNLDGVTIGDDYIVNVVFYLRNNGLLAEYNLSEIGLYAKGSDDVEHLYCVAYALPDNTEVVPVDDGTIQFYSKINMQTIISEDAEVTIDYAEEDHEWTVNYVKRKANGVDISFYVIDGIPYMKYNPETSSQIINTEV